MTNDARVMRYAHGMLRAPCIVCSILAVCWANVGAAQSRGHDLAADLLAHLGLTEHGELLEAGDVVHSGLLGEEELPEEVSAVGAMLLVRGVPPQTVVEAFLHTDTFREVHDVGRHGALPDSEDVTYAFETLSLDAQFDLARLARNPARDYNLSQAEAERFLGADWATAELAWHTVLGDRLESFVEGGVSQITPYTRSRGGAMSPAEEINAALHASAYLENEFPQFVSALEHPSASLAREFDQEYFWLETAFDGETVWALSVEQRLLRSDSALGADLHFYASRGYNSMLTFVGAVPYLEHSLVFAVNHTFTDEVIGFGAGIRKRVGRSRVAESLAVHLVEVRRQLE